MDKKTGIISKIDIANQQLLLELHEGCGKEGRTIHLRNDQFQCALQESDFMSMLCKIIRAQSELQYIKSKRVK